MFTGIWVTIEGFDDENSVLIGVKNAIRAPYCHPDALSLAGTFWILDKTLHGGKIFFKG